MYDDVLSELADAESLDVSRLLISAARSLTSEGMVRLGELGFSDVRASHFPVFGGAASAGTHISVLAQRAGHSRQAMSALVREVQAMGYVTTQPDPKDGRATLVILTERGVELCRAAAIVYRELTAEVEERIGAVALTNLRKTLTELAGPVPARSR